jgi:uncharacterized membrane protein
VWAAGFRRVETHQSVKEMHMTSDAMLGAFLGLETWNWILIIVLLVVVIVLLQIRKRQQ